MRVWAAGGEGGAGEGGGHHPRTGRGALPAAPRAPPSLEGPHALRLCLKMAVMQAVAKLQVRRCAMS